MTKAEKATEENPYRPSREERTCPEGVSIEEKGSWLDKLINLQREGINHEVGPQLLFGVPSILKPRWRKLVRDYHIEKVQRTLRQKAGPRGVRVTHPLHRERREQRWRKKEKVMQEKKPEGFVVPEESETKTIHQSFEEAEKFLSSLLDTQTQLRIRHSGIVRSDDDDAFHWGLLRLNLEFTSQEFGIKEGMAYLDPNTRQLKNFHFWGRKKLSQASPVHTSLLFERTREGELSYGSSLSQELWTPYAKVNFLIRDLREVNRLFGEEKVGIGNISLKLPREGLGFFSSSYKPENWARVEVDYNQNGWLAEIILTGQSEREDRETGYSEIDHLVEYKYRRNGEGKQFRLRELKDREYVEKLEIWGESTLEVIKRGEVEMVSLPFKLRSKKKIRQYQFFFPVSVDIISEIRCASRNWRLEVFGGF